MSKCEDHIAIFQIGRQYTTQNTNTNEEYPLAFQDDGVVRGRIVRLGGDILDKALSGSQYPSAVANILGEAVLLSVLLKHSLKFEGKLSVQAHGTNTGAISLLLAQANSHGHIRAMARYDKDALNAILANTENPTARHLLGAQDADARLAITIDPDTNHPAQTSMQRYQSMIAFEHEHLWECAQTYFSQSEQVPTRIILAVGQTLNKQDPTPALRWSGGGILLQKIADDTNRPDTEDLWNMAQILLATTHADELLDSSLSSADLLTRLFHEQGAALWQADPLTAQCSCSHESLRTSLMSFNENERLAMFDEQQEKPKDMEAVCEFCRTRYVFTKADLKLN